MVRKPGQFIAVRGSKILGTPPCLGRIKSIEDSNHYIVFEASHGCAGEEFDVDAQGYVLMGPPCNGRLVRAT